MKAAAFKILDLSSCSTACTSSCMVRSIFHWIVHSCLSMGCFLGGTVFGIPVNLSALLCPGAVNVVSGGGISSRSHICLPSMVFGSTSVFSSIWSQSSPRFSSLWSSSNSSSSSILLAPRCSTAPGGCNSLNCRCSCFSCR